MRDLKGLVTCILLLLQTNVSLALCMGAYIHVSRMNPRVLEADILNMIEPDGMDTYTSLLRTQHCPGTFVHESLHELCPELLFEDPGHKELCECISSAKFHWQQTSVPLHVAPAHWVAWLPDGCARNPPLLGLRFARCFSPQVL